MLTRLKTETRDTTYLWLLLRVSALGLQEHGDVMLVQIGELVVGEADDLAGPDPQARLLERFALHTRRKVLALLEVSAGEAPVSYVSSAGV